MNLAQSNSKSRFKSIRTLGPAFVAVVLCVLQAGCMGPEKQSVEAPDSSGQPPAGGNQQDYMENMQRIQREQGGGAAGSPGAGGAPSQMPTDPASQVPGDAASQPPATPK